MMDIWRMLCKACKYIGDSDYRFGINANMGKYDKMSDEEFLKRKFKALMGRKLDLENPLTFNEKLQWLKLYNRRPEYTMMADKYLVREYIAKTLGEEYLIPLLGVWDDPDEIDFDVLPDQFVLKCNHNSGTGMCICKDKSKLDIAKVRRELKRGLKENYYLKHREWPYRDIPRKIICEKYMDDGSGELRDYKIHCFNGEPQFILVCSDRFSGQGLREDFYDTNWRLTKLRRPHHPNSNKGIPRPEHLDDMLQYARKLAQGIPFVRIDFYVVFGQIYFGEITFFPASGMERFEPQGADEALGAMIDLQMGEER